MHTINITGRSYETFSRRKFVIQKFHSMKISRSMVLPWIMATKIIVYVILHMTCRGCMPINAIQWTISQRIYHIVGNFGE